MKLPATFSFNSDNVYNFDKPLAWFDWNLADEDVVIDFTGCKSANYQALSLLVLYAWHLHTHQCRVYFEFFGEGASQMWWFMGARGWLNVLTKPGNNFKDHGYKPLLALRDQNDFGKVLSRAEEYTKNFDVEYEKTLRYVISELLYNTLEHGENWWQDGKRKFPSLVQFTWYASRNELSFIVADLGVGIKQHLERAYPAFPSDVEAIREAIKPQVSGTFGASSPYKAKNNAGVGLFLSTNIIRRLRAEMFIVSGDGLLHISPRDITEKTLQSRWPGTLVFVTIKIRPSDRPVNLHEMMAQFRDAASAEIAARDETEITARYVVSILNRFGPYAENKEQAVNFRDRRLIPALEEGKSILLDFANVVAAPHSFLSALLATPIERLGMSAYKRLKITNAVPEIRETIDFILDENTGKS
jgi:hypothetical protein